MVRKKAIWDTIEWLRVDRLTVRRHLLLVAPSLPIARDMLKDLTEEAANIGLEVHSEKTKILRNGHGRATRMNEVVVQGRSFEVLMPEGSTKYLGRLLGFKSTHDVELKHRVAQALAKFGLLRDVLVDGRHDLAKRMQLFKQVKPCFLYGCQSWTLTREREQLIRMARRKMIRTIIGTRRVVVNGELEEWVPWIICATGIAENAMNEFKITDWVEKVHRRRFRWAGEVARRSDGRWSKVLLTWSAEGQRKKQRPLIRWTDSLNQFFAGDRGNIVWTILAQEKGFWIEIEEQYSDYILK